MPSVTRSMRFIFRASAIALLPPKVDLVVHTENPHWVAHRVVESDWSTFDYGRGLTSGKVQRSPLYTSCTRGLVLFGQSGNANGVYDRRDTELFLGEGFQPARLAASREHRHLAHSRTWDVLAREGGGRKTTKS